MLHSEFGTPGRVPTSIYNRRDYRPSAIRRQEHIVARFHFFIQFCCIKFNILPGFTSFVLGRLSLDQHRTAFSSLYETRTHPFGVAATETDLGFRNHYTLWYKLLVSVELPAGLNGCLHLELTYSFGFTCCLASSQHLHITGG